MGWGRPKFPWEGSSLTGLAGVRAAQGQGQGSRGPGELTPSSLLLHGGPALSLFSTKKKESRFSQQEVSAESIAFGGKRYSWGWQSWEGRRCPFPLVVRGQEPLLRLRPAHWTELQVCNN